MTKQPFEKSLKKLEQIVQELESGDLPLEKAIDKFEEGVKLSKICSRILDETEKRITILMQDAEGNTFEKPFMSENDKKDEQL